MNKAKFSVFFALLIVGIGFQSCSWGPEWEDFSSNKSSSSNYSSSAGLQEYTYCVYSRDEMCSPPGAYTSCPAGGELSNSCPSFNQSSSSNGTSSGGEGDASSSSVRLSSSSSIITYAFCDFRTDRVCLEGPWTTCPSGGTLSNDCHYDPSSSSRSSSSNRSANSNVSSSSNEPVWALIEEKPIYGEDIIDSRDNNVYKTVVINGKTWMAKNLNYEPANASGLSKCYAQGGGNGMDEWLTPEAAKPNCDKYGRLYDWVTAMGLDNSCVTAPCGSLVSAKHRGVCPNGWHIPSREEWNALKDHISYVTWYNYEDEDYDWDVGTKLKATSGWKAHAEYGNGVDTYGFNAIGSGFCAKCDDASLTSAQGYYSGETSQAYWWSATEYVNSYTQESKDAYSYEVTYDKNVMNEKRVSKQEYLYSVRCVKD